MVNSTTVEALRRPEDMAQIIEHDNPELLDATAYKLGGDLVKAGLTTSQIRNIFGTARTIQANWRPGKSRRRDLILLKPKLAYQAARMRPVEVLRDWLIAGINVVIANPSNDIETRDKEEYTRFIRFMEFFEAILAYHQAQGGRS